MKILTNNDYYLILHQVEEQKTVITIKQDMIDVQKELIEELIEENKILRNIINSQNLDFPNTERKGESAAGTPKTPDLFNEF